MRKRMTKADKLTLEQQIIDELADHYPQSSRHVYYRMTNPRLEVYVDKDEKGYKIIQQMLVDMRRAERIPFSAIADSSRSRTCSGGSYGYDTPEDFIESMGRGYKKNFWKDHEYHIEIWCESRSLAGTLKDVCWKYEISLDATVGFASDSQIYYASERMKSKLEAGKFVQIYYIGDYDPSGKLIDKDLQTKLMHHISGGNWLDFDKSKPHSEMCEEYEELYNFGFIRIAINEGQIEEYDLPTKPRKETEKRMPDMLETVEAEAMPVDDMRNILEGWINKIVTEDDFRVFNVAVESESYILKSFADAKLKGYEKFKKKYGDWEGLSDEEKYDKDLDRWSKDRAKIRERDD